MKKNKILFLSSSNFLRSYSGFQYLVNFFKDKNYDIKVFAHVPMSMYEECIFFDLRSCYSGCIGRIPILRRIYFKWKVKIILKKCDVLCINLTNFKAYYDVAIWFKSKFPNKKLILYCPELWTPKDINYKSNKNSYYNFVNNLNIIDCIIDVDFFRAKIRKYYYHKNTPIYVVPNTLEPINVNKLNQKFKTNFSYNTKKYKYKMIFTGVISKNTVSEIEQIFSLIDSDLRLVWYGHGEEHLIETYNSKFQSLFGKDRVLIYKSIPRNDLLSVISLFDAGLILYSVKNVRSLNQRFAAPSKLYEYLASGLPVVSYPNPSIKKILLKYNVGKCSKNYTTQSLAESITFLFSNIEKYKKNNIKNIFDKNLSYASCESTLNKIYDHVQ